MLGKPNYGMSPLYSIVKSGIMNSIKSGAFHVGDKLPSENALCEAYQVSRTTIRFAMQQLELEGIVHRIQGKGTFVSKPKLSHSFSKSFQEQLASQGLHANNHVLAFEIIPADSLLKDSLQIPENDPVIKLTRLRMADQDPLQHVTSYIPWKLAPSLRAENCSGSLFRLLKDVFNIKISHSNEKIEPVLVDENISKFLSVPIGSPILYLESVAFDHSGTPVEFSEAYVRSSLIIHNKINL